LNDDDDDDSSSGTHAHDSKQANEHETLLGASGDNDTSDDR